jgi:hypothetical protein
MTQYEIDTTINTCNFSDCDNCIKCVKERCKERGVYSRVKRLNDFKIGYDWFKGAMVDGLIDGMCFYQWLSNCKVNCKTCLDGGKSLIKAELCNIAQTTKWYKENKESLEVQNETSN